MPADSTVNGEPRSKRFDCILLGKKVGTYSQWERLDEATDSCGDADIFIFSNFRRNPNGRLAFPDFTDGHELVIAWFSGSVTSYDAVEDPAYDNPKDVHVDWSVFNS